MPPIELAQNKSFNVVLQVQSLSRHLSVVSDAARTMSHMFKSNSFNNKEMHLKLLFGAAVGGQMQASQHKRRSRRQNLRKIHLLADGFLKLELWVPD